MCSLHNYFVMVTINEIKIKPWTSRAWFGSPITRRATSEIGNPLVANVRLHGSQSSYLRSDLKLHSQKKKGGAYNSFHIKEGSLGKEGRNLINLLDGIGIGKYFLWDEYHKSDSEREKFALGLSELALIQGMECSETPFHVEPNYLEKLLDERQRMEGLDWKTTHEVVERYSLPKASHYLSAEIWEERNREHEGYRAVLETPPSREGDSIKFRSSDRSSVVGTIEEARRDISKLILLEQAGLRSEKKYLEEKANDLEEKAKDLEGFPREPLESYLLSK
jgi:hypothetical protein